MTFLYSLSLSLSLSRSFSLSLSLSLTVPPSHAQHTYKVQFITQIDTHLHLAIQFIVIMWLFFFFPLLLLPPFSLPPSPLWRELKRGIGEPRIARAAGDTENESILVELSSSSIVVNVWRWNEYVLRPCLSVTHLSFFLSLSLSLSLSLWNWLPSIYKSCCRATK